MQFVAWDIETDKLAPEEWNDSYQDSLKRKREGVEEVVTAAATAAKAAKAVSERGEVLRCDAAVATASGAPPLNITVAATRCTRPDGSEEALIWATPTEESGLTCPIPEHVYSALKTRTVKGKEGKEAQEEVHKEDRGDDADKEVADGGGSLLCEAHMRPEDVRKMALYLEDCVKGRECVISTYNAVGFDFRVVHGILEAEGRRRIAKAGAPHEAEDAASQYMELASRMRALAQSEHHFDIAFSFFAHRGFMVSLAKVSEATLGPGFEKFEISGADAPALFTKDRLWQNTVLKYCAQDVTLQAELHKKLVDTREFKWVTKKGGVSKWKVPTVGSGPDQLALNLGVRHSMVQPEPNVSWMEQYGMTPWPRSKFMGWLKEH